MAIASSAYKKALEGSQQRKEVLVKIDRVSKQFDETLAVDNVFVWLMLFGFIAQ